MIYSSMRRNFPKNNLVSLQRFLSENANTSSSSYKPYGLLNGIQDVKTAERYTNHLDISTISKLNVAQELYRCALMDVDNNKGLNAYFADIYEKSTKFIESDEVWDREDLKRELNTIISMKGCMVCLLAGKNSGKSKIVQDLDHHNLEKVFVINLREYQHIAEGLQITLRQHFRENENFLQKLFGAAWSATHIKLPSALKFVEVDSEKFLQYFQNRPSPISNITSSVEGCGGGSQQQMLHHLLDQMTKELPNITIIIDEANIIFDHSLDQSSRESVEILKHALALFTCYTKEKHQVTY